MRALMTSSQAWLTGALFLGALVIPARESFAQG
jgi:hypothetical protein